jgi:hypothetical protein
MGKIRETLSLTALVGVYLICSTRYYPGRPAESLLATLTELLTVAPFLLGGTLIANSLFHRFSGEQLPWSRLLRIYLTLGLTVEFFLGIYHYLKINQTG